MKSDQFPSYYPSMDQLGKYDLAAFLDSALIPCNNRAHVSVVKKEMVYLRYMMEKTATVMKVFRSRMCPGKNAVKEI